MDLKNKIIQAKKIGRIRLLITIGIALLMHYLLILFFVGPLNLIVFTFTNPMLTILICIFIFTWLLGGFIGYLIIIRNWPSILVGIIGTSLITYLSISISALINFQWAYSNSLLFPELDFLNYFSNLIYYFSFFGFVQLIVVGIIYGNNVKLQGEKLEQNS